VKRSKRWFSVATIFTLINLVGAPLALFAGEWLHFGSHVVLTAVGALWMWWVAGGRRSVVQRPDTPLADRQLAELQQSVDSIAVEVERIGESQRYAAKVAAERAAADRAQEHDASSS
jgi:hypothetical protein